MNPRVGVAMVSVRVPPPQHMSGKKEHKPLTINKMHQIQVQISIKSDKLEKHDILRSSSMPKEQHHIRNKKEKKTKQNTY